MQVEELRIQRMKLQEEVKHLQRKVGTPSHHLCCILWVLCRPHYFCCIIWVLCPSPLPPPSTMPAEIKICRCMAPSS